jgi:short-subunit dehydrogenase
MAATAVNKNAFWRAITIKKMAQLKRGDKALVTGASSGIGAAYADALAARGLNLVLVARREDRLRDLATRLHREFGIDALALRADLTDATDLARVEDALGSGGIDLLINNAGYGAYMLFVDLPPERAEELLRLKVIAPTRLARAVLPSMLERGSGAVINVASQVAFSGALQMPQLPLRATYAGANAYLVTFSELLHAEMGERGIRIQVLCPGLVRTDFHRIQNRDITALPNVMEAKDIVGASLAALELGEVICSPTVGDPSMVAAWEAAGSKLFASNQGAIADRYLTKRA